MVQISVAGLPSSGGVTVTKDGSIWWSSPLNVVLGQMVRLSTGFSVQTASVTGGNIYGAMPDRSMTATPNGFAWGTFDGTDPVHGFGVLEIVAAAAGVSVTSPPAGPPFPLPILSLVATPFIATGPDGNVWFLTQPGAPQGMQEAGGIGDVNELTDALTFTTTPQVNDFLTAVGVGPDKDLWAGGSINGASVKGFYRYSTSQQFLGSVVLSKPLSEIDAEVTGPDNALWFTDATDNLVGRVTTGGALKTFSVPTAGAKPLDITVGGDGALWFTENGAGKVGRITTMGTITEYTLPAGNTTPVQITGPFTSPGCGNAQLWLASNGNVIELIIKT